MKVEGVVGGDDSSKQREELVARMVGCVPCTDTLKSVWSPWHLQRLLGKECERLALDTLMGTAQRLPCVNFSTRRRAGVWTLVG